MGIREEVKKLAKDAEKLRKTNPVTRNGGGIIPGTDAEVPCNDQNLERAPKDSRYADVRGNTNHSRKPEGR